MDCPACHTAMIVLELDKIEIDHCLDCRGIWLDAGELEVLLDSADKKSEVFHSFQPVHASEKILGCPLCPNKMEKVTVGAVDKIIVDRCFKGHGLWFDLGELEKIVVSGGLNKNSMVVQFLQDMFSLKK